MLEKVFYRAKDIALIISCSVSNVYVLQKKGFLPKPIKFCKITLWKKEDVEKLINTISEVEK